MRTDTFKVKGNIGDLGQLTNIPGIKQVEYDLRREVISITHDRDPEQLPTVIKDQTIGRIILEPLTYGD